MLSVAIVFPDSLLRPSPQGLLAPLRAAHRDPLPPLAALVLAAGLLATGLVVRRRRPRTLEAAPPVPLEREVPDTRWLAARSEEHTSELQSLTNLVCRLLLEKKKKERRGEFIILKDTRYNKRSTNKT